jgi:hypothetical protein
LSDALTGDIQQLDFCCSASVLGCWNSVWSSPLFQKDIDYEVKGGTGFTVTTFINNKENQTAYEWLHKRYKILYQSPVRNGRHNRGCFLVIWDMIPDKKEVTK